MIRPGRDSRRHTVRALPRKRPVGTAHSGGSNNCYRDYAQTNAQDLMALLRAIDADVEEPAEPLPS